MSTSSRVALGVGLVIASLLLALWLWRTRDLGPPPRPVMAQPSSAPPPAARPPPAPSQPSAVPSARPSSPASVELISERPTRPAPPPSAEPTPQAAGASAWPLSSDGIRGAMTEAMPDIKRCYDQALAEVPELGGRLVLAFEVEDVDGVGEVSAVGIVGGDLEDGPLEECILDAMEALSFDAPNGGRTEVRWPLIFRAEGP